MPDNTVRIRFFKFTRSLQKKKKMLLKILEVINTKFERFISQPVVISTNFHISDLMAGQEAHVYKYADRSELYYQCQISITIKEPNSECPRPQCSEPQGFGAVKSAAAPAPAASPLSPRRYRLIKKRSTFSDNIVDVRTDFSTVDISEVV